MSYMDNAKIDCYTLDFIVPEGPFEEFKITSEVLSDLMGSSVWHKYLKMHNLEMKRIGAEK